MHTQRARRRPFSWSYSTLSRFETCPRQYKELNVERRVKDTPNEHSSWGTRAHEMLADALRYRRLPDGLERVHHVIKAIWNISAEHAEIEGRYALNRDWQLLPDFFHRDAWVRVVMDCLIIRSGYSQGIVIDWKTGKMKDDLTQVYLYALATMKMFPALPKVKVSLVWTQTGDITGETVTREQAEHWWETDMKARVQAMESAYLTGEFPARQSGLCGKWCPVPRDYCVYGRIA